MPNKVMDFLDTSDPRRVAALPLRPSWLWLEDEATKRKANIIEATEDLVYTWNTWADYIERILQQASDQTKDLEVSDETYISFIRLIAAHSRRPSRWHKDIITEYAYWYLHDLWSEYANMLERTHRTMAAELSRCNLLSCPFESTSTTGRLHGILRSMVGAGGWFPGLDDRRGHETNAVSETSLQGRSFAQLASGIEHMSLSGAPATRMDVAEGLAIELKRMSIEGGNSRID